MRVRRLDLTRYGKFTDHSIDFGESRRGEPDLHVVYGPNEAGKSTALAAFLDLVYGIEMRSPYGFLHPYPTMRIGAAVELSAGTRHVVRVKRPQNSLLDGSDQPISEGILLGDLGGIDRESYRTMFSLDDETLETGGENILASKGDLGELLFSASAGLADLSGKLLDLKKRAYGFYKKHARSGELADLKSRLRELKEERERIDTFASRYTQLVASRDKAASLYEEAIAGRGRVQARMDDIQRLLNALPRLTALRTIRERLAPLRSLPDVPPGLAADLPEIQNDEIELTTRADSLRDEVERLSRELDAIAVDRKAMDLADRIPRLAELRARHLTAAKDIPERRLRLRETEAAIAGIKRRIGREDEVEPARLVLGSAVLAALREAMEARSGVLSALASADSELSAARRRLADARDRLEKAGGGNDAGHAREAALASFAATVALIRADDHATRQRLAARSHAAGLDSLAGRLRALQPWTGDADRLFEMAVPDGATIERWIVTAAEARKEADSIGNEVERLAAQRARLKAEIDAIGSVAGLAGDQEGGALRAARERAWSDHRRMLDAASADTFEMAMRRDDVVTSTRFAHVSELASFRQAVRDLAVTEAALADSRERHDRSQAVLRQVADEIAAAIEHSAPGLPTDMPARQFEAWLGSRALALEARASVRSAERDMREAEADAVAARDRLRAAFVSAEIAHDADAGFEVLLAEAQAVIDRESELRMLRRAVEERRREMEDREREREKAAANDLQWTRKWAEACSACWLGDAGRSPPISEVREILSAVAELGPAIEKKDGLADRIAKMERDQAEFAAELSSLALGLDLASKPEEILGLASAVDARLQGAVAARANRAEKERALGSALDRQRALAERIAIHVGRKAELLDLFGVGSLAEAARSLQGTEKRTELSRDADAAELEILTAVGTATLDEAELALDRADRAALEAEFAGLKSRHEDQDRRSRDLFAEQVRAEDQIAAVGGDEAAARLEERRRTMLLEVEDGARRYLKLRIGVAAAEHALRAYRDRHRSSMMSNASDAFRTISRGAYRGLTTQPGKDAEILVAIDAEGGSKIASALSKGTRFQLYLALRVAGYREFASSRRPVPFLADDIMETFDDFRAEEAFRLFADMARVGQVIYFTHHSHLCTIARRVCPNVAIHLLGTPPSAPRLVVSNEAVAESARTAPPGCVPLAQD